MFFVTRPFLFFVSALRVSVTRRTVFESLLKLTSIFCFGADGVYQILTGLLLNLNYKHFTCFHEVTY
jgi:hypothetical protein